MMKKTFIVFTLFSVLMTACAAEAAPTEEAPNTDSDEQSPPTDASTNQTPAQQAAVSTLSENLGIPADSITLVSTEAVEWPNSCLGIQEEGLECTQAITPGFRFILKANDREVEYRTNEDGTQVRPATVVMKWKREGGIAGFCDYVTVYLSGEVHRSSCKNGQPSEERLINVLPEPEITTLDGWVQEYGTVTIDASDPKGVSDRMVVMLEFLGLGSEETLTSEDERELLEFAQLLSQSAPLK